MIRCVFHIGVPKTGSTALQRYLARHWQLSTPHEHRYVVIGPHGEVLDGRHIKAKSPSSTRHLWELEDLESIGERLRSIADRGVPVISQEDFARNGRGFLERNVLERLDVCSQIVVYVRPQIEWFNSAWW